MPSRWAGNENPEERVDGAEAIDPVVLEELRRLSSEKFQVPRCRRSRSRPATLRSAGPDPPASDVGSFGINA
jgi:hypothetical protein